MAATIDGRRTRNAAAVAGAPAREVYAACRRDPGATDPCGGVPMAEDSRSHPGEARKADARSASRAVTPMRSADRQHASRRVMLSFVRRRGLSLALVVLVVCAVSLAQGSISSTVAFGALRGPVGFSLATVTAVGYGVRWAVVAVMAALWLFGKKRPLFVLVIVVNVFSTLALLMHTAFLSSVLAGLSVG